MPHFDEEIRDAYVRDALTEKRKRRREPQFFDTNIQAPVEPTVSLTPEAAAAKRTPAGRASEQREVDRRLAKPTGTKADLARRTSAAAGQKQRRLADRAARQQKVTDIRAKRATKRKAEKQLGRRFGWKEERGSEFAASFGGITGSQKVIQKDASGRVRRDPRTGRPISTRRATFMPFTGVAPGSMQVSPSGTTFEQDPSLRTRRTRDESGAIFEERVDTKTGKVKAGSKTQISPAPAAKPRTTKERTVWDKKSKRWVTETTAATLGGKPEVVGTRPAPAPIRDVSGVPHRVFLDIEGVEQLEPIDVKTLDKDEIVKIEDGKLKTFTVYRNKQTGEVESQAEEPSSIKPASTFQFKETTLPATRTRKAEKWLMAFNPDDPKDFHYVVKLQPAYAKLAQELEIRSDEAVELYERLADAKRLEASGRLEAAKAAKEEAMQFLWNFAMSTPEIAALFDSAPGACMVRGVSLTASIRALKST